MIIENRKAHRNILCNEQFIRDDNGRLRKIEYKPRTVYVALNNASKGDAIRFRMDGVMYPQIVK